MLLVYWIAVRTYFSVIRLAARLGNQQAMKWVRGRAEAPPLPDYLLVQQAGQKVNPDRPPLVWMHCASLGEWEQGRPVLAAFRKQHPEYLALLTFFSPSGYERCKEETAVNHVAYLPADGPATARRWLIALQPSLAIFVKYEFWFFHLQALYLFEVPTFLVAANFRPGQYFFRWYIGWGRRMLRFFTGIATQEAEAAALLTGPGGLPQTQVTVCGDPRMDRTLALTETPFSDPIITAFTTGQFTIIAGSVWPEDLEVLRLACSELPEEVRLILAPHQLHEAELARTQVQWEAARYTQTSAAEAASARILLLDTIGMLSRVYRYGDLAYVGGAFRTGLHNTLEPLAYGLPVVFGPRHHKFPEAAAAIAAGGAWSVASADELREVLQRLLEKGFRAEASAAQRALARRSAGAARRTVNFITQKLPPTSKP